MRLAVRDRRGARAAGATTAVLPGLRGKRAAAGGADETRGRGVERLATAGAVVALAFATYLYYGYRYGAWPQALALDYVLRFSGELENDWYTSLPPPHWAFTHALGLVPSGLTEEAFFAGWLAGLALLWAGFLSICRTLGMPLLGALGAGLVVIPTELGGVGLSQPHIFDMLYPNGLSFAVAVAGIAALLRGRTMLAAGALGAATVVHPNVGLLASAAVAPAFIVVHRERLRDLLRPAAVFAAIAAFPLIRVALDQGLGSPLSPERRYGLLTTVRAPHHYLYGAFPASEYVQTGLWLAALVAGLLVLRRLRASLVVAVIAGTVLGLCGVGALAGQAGGPLVLVQAQTARLSPLIVLFGIAAAGAALARLSPALGAALLIAIALVAPAVTERLGEGDSPWAGSYADWVSETGVEAALALAGLAALGLAAAIRARRRHPGGAEHDGVPSRWRRPPPPRARLLGQLAAAALFVVAAISLVAEHDERKRGRDHDVAFEDIAKRARAASRPADVILTPPDLYKFRVLSHRPTVVDFWTFPFGVGDAAWVERINAVSGDPSLLEPRRFGRNSGRRRGAIGRAYERNVRGSPAVLCRYGVRFVVTRQGGEPPPWLAPVARNRRFLLFRVRPGACAGRAPS